METIRVNYESSDSDWSVTVSSRDQQLTGQAAGIIAARDLADRLIEQIAPDDSDRTSVHLLDGDPVEFTVRYINARHGRPAESAAPEPATPETETSAEAEVPEQNPVTEDSVSESSVDEPATDEPATS